MNENVPPITEYFTGLAEIYDRYRPRYAEEAVAQTLEGLSEPIDVADIGCGTGIAARQYAAAGCRVVGIEPNAEMLAVARKLSGGSFHQATAERTGLADGSVDLVVCAQAFHWFEPPEALAEFHRILRPGGRLALMWNVRREDNPFSAGYADVVRRSQAAARESCSWGQRNRLQDPTMTGHFVNPRRLTFDNPQRLDRDGVLNRARSASYFPRQGPLREQLERTLLDLFDRHARDGHVTIRQRTELSLADRAG
jgi:ubiquinone/menaquinone biosynthesis C-methylase UbiE